jgi:hypothetical protein
MQKYFIIIILIFFNNLCFAGINAKNGYYIGGEAGRAIVLRPDGAAFDPNIFFVIIYPFFGGNYFFKPVIGYRFNNYIALEASYSQLLNERYTPDPEKTSGLGPDHYKLNIIDLSGKIIYPFKKFSLYGILGFSFVHQNVFNQRYINGPILIDSNTDKVLTLFGLGTSYNFNQKFAVNLNASYLEGSKPIRDIHRLSLCLYYTF